MKGENKGEIVCTLKAVEHTVKYLAGSRQVPATISTEQTDVEGDIVRASGCVYDDYMKTRAVLWSHDAAKPVARCLTLDVRNTRIDSTCQFPPSGVSPLADEIFGLIEAGVVNATSIGFIPLKCKPLGKKGMDILEWRLLEWSFVASPANPQALITQRAIGDIGTSYGGLTYLERRQLERQIECLRYGRSSIDPGLMKRLSKDRQQRIRQLEVLALKMGEC